MNKCEIIIEVDEITSGKYNIISFLRNRKQINFPPLTLKPNSTSSEYNFNHHFDKDDLVRLNTSYPSIHPYEANISKEKWTGDIKAAFKQLIQDGEFDQVYKQNADTISVKYVWIN